MTKLNTKYGKWAMVAGSAIGLGETFCRELAKHGFNLFMIDNREVELKNLASQLSREFGIETIPLKIDLFNENAVSEIMERTKETDIRLMLYVAAYSRIQKFTNLTLLDLEHFVNINVSTPLKLVHSFATRLTEKKLPGGILLMSSLAGLLGMQYIVPYAASKAFTWNLAESLHHELKPHNIDVMACIAGATATEAYLDTKPKYGFIKPLVQQPSEVAKLALKKLGKKTLFIPGFSNRMNYFILTRLLPRKLASYFANQTMKKMYSENV